MKLLIITSCTGKKRWQDKRHLTQNDFQQGADHVARREHEMTDVLTIAEHLYTGEQHVRLMRGVYACRERFQTNNAGSSLALWIVSAGYGLVRHDCMIAPYECTFQGMRKTALRRWAEQLHLPADIRRILAQPYDLGMVLLGESYLEACGLLNNVVSFGGPTLVFCGVRMAQRLGDRENVYPVVLSSEEAQRFSCGLVALKGEVVGRLLEHLAANPDMLGQLQDPRCNVLGLVDKRTMDGTQ